MTGSNVRIGVDTGGTFTDVVLYDADREQIRVVKTPSTPPDFERGVLEGVDRGLSVADRDPDDVAFLSHGTTVGTNAVLEGNLPAVGLVTNEGLRDVLAIGDQTRPALYDLQAEKPDPPVARRHRRGVPGRLDERGDVLAPLDEQRVRAVARAFADEGLETVVVSMLFSYLNPDHERRVAAILEDEGLEAVLSADVHPEIREYDRTVTTALNAGVRTRVEQYLDRLSAGVQERGIPAPVNVMHSGGGLFSTAAATTMAIRTVLSGPAAGAVAVREVAARGGYPDAVGMDVGGTSADVSILRGGELVRTTEGEIGDLPVKTPMINVTTVGAGGGSVVRVDPGGGLRVGPESAGADPGPVCYDRGGDRPTLTDANLLLGRINPDYFQDGKMDLAVERAREVFERDVAEPLGESVERAALATVRVATAGLAREIRRVTVERGHDPGAFALVAFGGAGPLQAAAVAREVGTDVAVVPPSPGVFSARGLLLADVRVDESRSYRGALEPSAMEGEFERLEARLHERLRDQGFESEGDQGLDPDGDQEFDFEDDGHVGGDGERHAGEVTLERAVDLRYRGQSYELTVGVGTPLDGEALAGARERFHRAHERRYGHAMPDEPLEAVTLRATGRVATPPLVERTTATDEPSLQGTREVRFEDGERAAEIHRRTALDPGQVVVGPAVLEETGSTTLVPPGATAGVSDDGSVVIDP